jgi:alkylation response protein AidB-like acyl-CoA dehydrogenase
MTGETEFCEVFFEDVRVPADMMVGAPGSGWQIAMGILQHERGPVWTFTFQRKIRRSFNRLVRTVREHPAGGKGLDDALVRQRLAQSYIEVELLKLMGYRSLTHILRTGHPGPESSLEKVIGSETDQRLQETAMTCIGPHALLEASGLLRDYMYSRSETIMGGTSEIQRNVIAQRILGLPR